MSDNVISIEETQRIVESNVVPAMYPSPHFGAPVCDPTSLLVNVVAACINWDAAQSRYTMLYRSIGREGVTMPDVLNAAIQADEAHKAASEALMELRRSVND